MNVKDLCKNHRKLTDVVTWAIGTSARRNAYDRLSIIEKAIRTLVIEGQISDAERIQAHKVLAWVNQAQIAALEMSVGIDLDGDGFIGTANHNLSGKALCGQCGKAW